MKKITTLVLAAVMVVSMVGDVSAYSFTKTNSKNGTYGEFKVSGDGVADVPWNPLGDVTMESYGTSKLTYNDNKTGYTKKLIEHTITVDTTAVGFPALEISASGVSGSVTLQDRNTAIIDSGHTSDWDYSIITTYGRMTTYKQTHNMSYYLRKNGKNKATVSMSGYWKWGF